MDDHITQMTQGCAVLLTSDADPLTEEQRAHIATMLESIRAFSELLETKASDHLIHDLRRPLSVVHSCCYLLLTETWGPLSTTHIAYLEHIYRASQALIEGVNQMALSV